VQNALPRQLRIEFWWRYLVSMGTYFVLLSCWLDKSTWFSIKKSIGCSFTKYLLRLPVWIMLNWQKSLESFCDGQDSKIMPPLDSGSPYSKTYMHDSFVQISSLFPEMCHFMSLSAFTKIRYVVAMVTHFLLLSYSFDMSTMIFHKFRDVSIPKMYDSPSG